MGDQIRACQACSAENAENAKFCSQCATSLETAQGQEIAALEAAAAAEPTGTEPAGEQQTVERPFGDKQAAEEPAAGDPTGLEPAAVASSGSFVNRKRALLIGGGVAVLVAMIAVVAAMTLGGPSTDTKRASATTKTEAEPTKPDPAAQDTDGDGTPDTEDGAVFDANSTTTPAYDSADDTSTDEFDDAPSSDDEDYLDDTEQETQHTAVSVGQPGVDDNVTFKVLSLEAVSSIPTDEFSDGPMTAKPGAKLVKAVVRWKNNMDKSADIFCGGGGAILIDQNNRNFDPVEDQIDIAGNNICGEDVQPGFTQTVTLAFQMPKDSNTTELALWNGDAEDDFDGQQSDVRVSK
jgi:hypothetical protein